MSIVSTFHTILIILINWHQLIKNVFVLTSRIYMLKSKLFYNNCVICPEIDYFLFDWRHMVGIL